MPEATGPAVNHGAVDELTVDELAATVGLPVRTVRFYAGRKLLPAPRLEGRTGRYGPVHVARLSLVRDLQRAGYTLAAIEQFLEALPDDADAATVEMYGTLLVPWVPQETVTLTAEELADRLGRDVDAALVEILAEAHVLEVGDNGEFVTTNARLDYGSRLLGLDAPLDALVESGRIIRRHANEMAEELQREFRNRILARFDDASPEDRDRLRALTTALRPLVIQNIVTTFHEALDREVRAQRDVPAKPKLG